MLYSFADTNDACDPASSLVIQPGGAIYGLTELGGANGYGALYELQPPPSAGGAWTEIVLYSFDIDAGGATGSLIQGPGGSFYVLVGVGALFQLLPPGESGGAWTGFSCIASALQTWPTA